MAHFMIDDFDFGVDASRSSLTVKDSKFELKLVGLDSVIAKTIADESHRWNWLIQPPFLYAVGVPCRLDAQGDFEHDITEQDLDDYDISLYAMEHCDVLPCKVTKKGGLVTVSGKVHGIRREALDFRGEFKVEDSGRKKTRKA